MVAPPQKKITFFGNNVFLSRFTLKIISVLLSASVEKVGVSHMRDFFLMPSLRLNLERLNKHLHIIYSSHIFITKIYFFLNLSSVSYNLLIKQFQVNILCMLKYSFYWGWDFKPPKITKDRDKEFGSPSRLGYVGGGRGGSGDK